MTGAFTIAIEPDNDAEAPWDSEDGHGPISAWTKRDKKPGELVLCDGRQLKRFYDFAGAVAIAKRDKWGPGTPAQAARADYERLRAWCNDEWHYVGVLVTRTSDGETASLWGIESDDTKYLDEVALELQAEIEASDMARAQAVQA